jgi:hypothetical protein
VTEMLSSSRRRQPTCNCRYIVTEYTKYTPGNGNIQDNRVVYQLIN